MSGLFERGVYAAKRLLRRRILARRRALERAPAREESLLVLMDAGMGNAVEATPLVQALRSLRPRARIAIVPPRGDLFDDWCVVDRVARGREELSGIAFDATFVAWSAAVPDKCLVPGRIHRAEGLFRLHPLVHERDSNLRLARRLGYRGPTPPLYVSVREPNEPLPPAEERIAVCPGGKPEHRWRHKRWMRWGELLGELRARRPGAQVVLLGAPEDEVGPLPPGILDLRGRLTPRECAFVLRASAVAVGNDCGPMHVADAVLTPSVVLFGPTCEIKNGPRNRGLSLSSNAPCRPCQFDFALLDGCADPVCMKGIGVAAVAEAVLGAMRKSAAS